LSIGDEVDREVAHGDVPDARMPDVVSKSSLATNASNAAFVSKT
jgi:hypothetical protein